MPQEGDRMSEQAPESGEGQAPEQPQQQPAQESEQPQQQSQETFDKEYVERIRREAAEYRTKLRALEKTAEQQRQASMTEAERAVAEAEQRGRQTATADLGRRLARAEIRSAAADAGKELEGVFDYLDLTRFVTDDGEPNAKEIQTFVGGLKDKATPPPVTFDGGTRTDAKSTNMNDFIRGRLARR